MLLFRIANKLVTADYPITFEDIIFEPYFYGQSSTNYWNISNFQTSYFIL